jgi:D-alanine-D-alanine ligase
MRMSGEEKLLALIYEPEEACRRRLVADGFEARHAIEISSYLAQSTDLAAEFDAIGDACAQRGITFRPVELDAAAGFLATCPKDRTLAWTLTDGVAYFRGGAGPTLSRLNGLAPIGSDDALFALCQDKFRSGAVLGALGLPAPRAGLARDGRWILPPPASSTGWFVKPNRLGAKIGIWPDSRTGSPEDALAISRRIHAAYRDDAIVQPYVAGRNVRASYLAVSPVAGPDRIGVFFVDSGGDFQTMQDSMALYGDTGMEARVTGAYVEPALVPVAAARPGADSEIRRICARLMSDLGLRDVFSADFRVEEDDTVHLIEFEVCPGLPCFDFRAYCRAAWKMELADAIAETAAARFAVAAK